MPVSKLKVALSKFVAVRKDDEDNVKFLARVEPEAKGIVGSYTHPEHDTCLASLHNRGQLNHVFELAGVAYGSRVVPGTDEFTEVSRKRRMDATGKNPIKHARTSGKKKVEIVKAAAPRGKASLKRPFNAEVASARAAKQSKKTTPRPAATVTMMRVATEPSGPKGAAGASGSKGTDSAKKIVVPARKCRVPAIGVMAEASSAESHESSPHGLTAQVSMPEILSRPEPHSQSPRVSLPDIAPRLEPEALLQITMPGGTGGALIPNLIAAISVG
jgi:hypothetical protein